MSDKIKNKFTNTSAEHVNRWCALPAQYPEPKVVGPNYYYAMLLWEDYAGVVSEMTRPIILNPFFIRLTYNMKQKANVPFLITRNL